VLAEMRPRSSMLDDPDREFRLTKADAAGPGLAPLARTIGIVEGGSVIRRVTGA